MKGAANRLRVTGQTRPRLPRHVKLRLDRTRERWVILAPERILLPDEIAIEVLQLCDGQTVDDIAGTLAEKYTADRSDILRDIAAMLQELADDGFVVDAGPEAEHG